MFAGIKKLAPRIIMTNFVFILLAQTFITKDAEAIPAFARQVGQPCTACHAQHFPTLNGFGRMFKAQGYTMAGTQEMVEGDGLSIPSALNAAIVGTLALQDSTNSAKKAGFPASLSIYFGGRVSPNSGFLMEMPFEGASYTDASGNEQEVEPAAGPGIAQLGSLKWNYVQDVMGVTAGLNAFSTAMAGPAYGYELLSTGAMGMNVAQPGANAMGAIGLHMEHGATLMGAVMDDMAGGNMNMNMNMAGTATGFGTSAQNSMGYVYYSAYFGAQSMDYVESPEFAHYVRAVLTPMVAGWDLGLGVQLYRGGWSVQNGTKYKAEATTFDFQAQGMVVGLPVGVYASYATAPKSASLADLNWYNFSTRGDNESFGVLVDAEMMRKLSVFVGYTSATYFVDALNADSTMVMTSMSRDYNNTMTQVGANYLLAPNKRLGLKVASIGGDLGDTVTAIDLMVGY